MTRLPTRHRGKLIVGIDDSPPPPMELGEPGSSDFRGYEVDILNAVAERLGVRLRYRRAVWSQILDELQRGLIDVVCTAATYTSERARALDYGRPYLGLALSVVVRRNDATITDLGALRGRPFAVRSATTAEAYIRDRLAPSEVHTFEYNADTYDALLAGNGDAVVDDSPIARWFVGQLQELVMLADLPGTESHYAMVFAKDSALRDPIDAEIERLETEGRLDEWQRRWFATPVAR